MIVFKFLIINCVLLGVINCQFCCNDNSMCPSNASCLCQKPIDSCIYEIIQSPNIFNLGQSTSYYNWVPSTNEYISVTISICSNQTISIKAGLKIQNQNATGYPTESNIIFSISPQQCYQMYLASPHFCQTPSGGYCNLILSLIQNGSSLEVNKRLSIKVSFIQGLTKYIVFILIAIGCVLLLIIVILVACMIRKKMIGNPIQQKKQIYTIHHLQNYTLKGKYKDLVNKTEASNFQTCSVCLAQMKENDIIRKTPCAHLFHSDCVDLWCIRNLTCPICRQSFDQDSLAKRKLKTNHQISDGRLRFQTQQTHQIEQPTLETQINFTNKKNAPNHINITNE